MKEYRETHDIKNIIKMVVNKRMLLSLTVKEKGKRYIIPGVNIKAFKKGLIEFGCSILNMEF